MKSATPLPALETSLFRPGMKVAVACSGGADSVALLRALLERRNELGVVLSVAHMNHGIRGAEAAADEGFVRELATRFDLPLDLRLVDVPAAAEAERRGLEETARSLRYAWFWEILAAGRADAVVTAHTLNDQAETVLHRILRGAWTEGLSGIFPTLDQGAKNQAGALRPAILRPLLATSRSEVEDYLRSIAQPWREDSTNRDPAYTRNRIRHELLPLVSGYNPGIQKQLAQLATLARDEESYWQAELARLLPSILLPGKAVRGGGRATSTLHGASSLAIELERLRSLHPALQRRVLRAAARQLGVSLNYEDTAHLVAACESGQPGKPAGVRMGMKLQMQNGLHAERTPRELRLSRLTLGEDQKSPSAQAEYTLLVPGRLEAPEFGLIFEARVETPSTRNAGHQQDASLPPACLRTSRAADRVTLRHSHSRLKVKEALHRSRLPATANCPVVEWRGEIVWMAGIAVDSRAARDFCLSITATPLESADPG